MSTYTSMCRHHMMEIGQLSGELGPKSSLSNFCRQYSTLASHTLPLSSSLREATKFVATKEAAVAKSSSFGLLALQDKLSFRHWSMIDATPAEIKLLVADVVTYKWNVAACMIARFWRRYVFQTRAETLIGTSASTTKPVKVSALLLAPACSCCCLLLGHTDAAISNNFDKSSQRGRAVLLVAPRVKEVKDLRVSLEDFECQKTKRTNLSTTVAELYALTKCFGTCQFLRGP